MKIISYIKHFTDRSETASLLLDYKANVRISDNSGMKPLSWMITKMPPVVGIAKQNKNVLIQSIHNEP